MGRHQLIKEIFQTVLLGNGIVYIKPTQNITIEAEMARNILESCFADIDNPQNLGLILNMTRVAFVTEEAREVLCDGLCVGRGISHLAFVSSNHLSNVISTLTMKECSSSQIQMRMFNSAENAVDWLQEREISKQFLEAAC
ncbi:MAG: hypothetical protein H6603_06660 [Flavobacteriales bacterium]|nr:hypothetical protein [Flavobacteriales bacterium]MCB9190395.1 hypothetical protein [Flavobacteriales bacterium]MCB9204644.1 hypothetical protein [Flavobacteriales bacterium]